MILKQNFHVLVPKYIGTISLSEQIQRVDWGAVVFGSWVAVAVAVAQNFKRDFKRA